MAYFYSVTATLPDETTASAYRAWLAEGHVQAVVAAGASAARVVRLESAQGQGPRIESQYVFPSREAFDRYVATAAPALRAEGLAKFPPSRGIVMERRAGEVVIAI